MKHLKNTTETPMTADPLLCADYFKFPETEFQVLMHCQQYVDSNLLEKGIYSTNKPVLYSKTETIESLTQRGKIMKDMTGACFISESYFENLSKCQLKRVSILIGA